MTDIIKRTRKKKEVLETPGVNGQQVNSTTEHPGVKIEVVQEEKSVQPQKNKTTVVKMPDGSTVTTTEKMTIVSY